MTEVSPVDTSAAQAAPAPNLLTNPSFELVGPTGPYYDSRNAGTRPAAAEWGTYIQPIVQNPVITEDLLPSTCPGGSGGRMLHVTLNGTGGITHTFSPGIAHANFSVWVFVVKGKVGAGVGPGGAQAPTQFAGRAGTWEHLTGSRTTSPGQPTNNEFIVYGTDTGYNDFYVDLASVTAAS